MLLFQRFNSVTFFVNDKINLYPLLKNEIDRYREKYELINSMKAERNVNTNKQEEKNVDNESFKKLLDKIAENPDLITCKGNEVYSLSKIEAVSSSKLKKFRMNLKLTKHGNNINTHLGFDTQLNQFQVNAHGSANESINYSRGNPISKESDCRSEPKETKMLNYENRYSFQRQQSFPVKHKIYNWRTECKDC